MTTDQIAALEASIRRSVAEHDPRLDSVLFNGGTLLALAATIAATAAPWTGQHAWIARALTGLAAFLIGAERALNFGERWRYHRRMRGAYQTILERLSVARALDAPEQRTAVQGVITDLEQLRTMSGDIPVGSLNGASGGAP